jgi:hypothetical protein
LDADAVGTCKVITGVVVFVATVDDKSVPVVPSVNAATLVTVPTLAVLPKLTDDPLIVMLELIRPAFGNPVQLVNVPLDGVPKTGVVRVGLVKVLLVSVCVFSIDTALSAA